MNRFLAQIVLLLAGLILSVIGAAILVAPHALFAKNGVTLGSDPSLLSDIRAPGGLLLASGVVVLLGALRHSMRRQALMLAAMVYGAFGVSRLLAMAIDGAPSESLLWATGTELFLAASCVVSLHRHQLASLTIQSGSAMDVYIERTTAAGGQSYPRTPVDYGLRSPKPLE